MDRQLWQSSSIEISQNDSDFTQHAFWHSSAHVLGYAIEQYYKEPLLTVGPPTDQGFFYDFFSPHGEVVSEAHYGNIEEAMKKIIKAKLKFERLDLTRDEALDMFQHNRFKTHLLQTKVPADGLTSVYRIGDFVDLCTGPHIAHTGLV
jgi:threonyl-tRNA synthetase